MPVLYRTATIDRMWVLLEAHAPFTDIIASARRVKDTPLGWLKKMMFRSIGDFPHVQIEMGDNFGGGPIPTDTFTSETPAYGSGPDDYFLEERTSDFKLSFFYESPGFDQQDELEMTAIEAFEAAGRSLGYAYAKRWGPWRARRNILTLVNNVERPVTQILIPVVYDFTNAELKPEP